MEQEFQVSVRCDKLPKPFTVSMASSGTVDALLEQICTKIEVQAAFKDALIIKKGFPPRPAELVKT